MADTKTGETPTEVVPATSGGDLVPLNKVDVKAWLEGADLTDDDDEFLDLDDAIRILSAGTPEAALKLTEMREVDTLRDKRFGVLGITWRKSTRSKSGKGRYAILRCVDSNGEQFLTTCGATKVVLQLRKFELAGWFPAEFQLRISDTESGNTVKELVAPEKDF